MNTLTPQGYKLVDDMISSVVAKAVAAERERCAKIAEKEPEAPGDMPSAFHSIPLEDAIRAAIRVTKKSIASRIRKDI